MYSSTACTNSEHCNCSRKQQLPGQRQGLCLRKLSLWSEQVWLLVTADFWVTFYLHFQQHARHISLKYLIPGLVLAPRKENCLTSCDKGPRRNTALPVIRLYLLKYSETFHLCFWQHLNTFVHAEGCCLPAAQAGRGDHQLQTKGRDLNVFQMHNDWLHSQPHPEYITLIHGCPTRR